MKVIIIIIIIFTLIIGSWLLINNWLQKSANDLKNTLTETRDYIRNNDWQNASSSFEKLDGNWVKLREFWTILLDHHEIDNMDLAMSRAKEYINSNSKTLSLAEIEVLTSLVNIVVESESLSLSNIL